MDTPNMRFRPGGWQGLAAALAMALLAGTGHAYTSGATLIVIVLPDRYAAVEASFSDLNNLQVLVDAMKPSLLRLEACGTPAALPLLAAAERFRQSRLELQMLSPDDRDCGVAATLPAATPGGSLATIDAAYWQSVMP